MVVIPAEAVEHQRPFSCPTDLDDRGGAQWHTDKFGASVILRKAGTSTTCYIDLKTPWGEEKTNVMLRQTQKYTHTNPENSNETWYIAVDGVSTSGFCCNTYYQKIKEEDFFEDNYTDTEEPEYTDDTSELGSIVEKINEKQLIDHLDNTTLIIVGVMILIGIITVVK